MTQQLRFTRATIALAFSTALAGCMVGPNYQGAPRVAPLAQTSNSFARAAVAPTNGTPPLAEWWRALNDDALDRLEATALANSPDVAQARARILAARATVRENVARLLPQGAASATYIHARLPDTTDFTVGQSASGGGSAQSGAETIDRNLNLYSLGADATWEVDLFGGTRRQVTGARASLQASEADLQDTQVTLTRNVASTYVNLRSSQQRLLLAQESTQLRSRILEITRERRRLGTASDADVEQAVSSLKQTQGNVLPISAQVEVYLDELAALVGQEPGTLDAQLGPAAPLPLPPTTTAIGNPADLLRRRPDIRAAERRLASRNETIGADIAQYFPTLSLVGFLGVGSSSTGNLLSSRNLTAVGAPSLSWNILNFPAIRAQVREARANYAEQEASYRETVLNALRDANEALSRFGHQRDNVATLVDRQASAERSTAIARMRRSGGTVSDITLLNAQADRVSSQDNLMQGQAEFTSDWITLQSALGLGWAPVRS